MEMTRLPTPRFRHVLVLCTGRCGSQTFVRACQHFTNYSAGHETRARLLGDDRLAYPDGHIEADNRLSWMLGRVQSRFGNDAFYVHLQRDAARVADSYDKRWDHRFSLIDGYNRSILMQDRENPGAARDMVETITANIKDFLSDKSHVIDVDIDNPAADFLRFCDLIDATGDMDAALAEFGVLHNASAQVTEGSADSRPRIGQISAYSALKESHDRITQERDALAQQLDRLQSEVVELRGKLKKATQERARIAQNRMRSLKEIKHLKRKARKRRKLGLVLAAPTLLLLSPILLPYFAYRKLRKSRPAKEGHERLRTFPPPLGGNGGSGKKEVASPSVHEAFQRFGVEGPGSALAYVDTHAADLPPQTRNLFAAMAAENDAEWLSAFNVWGQSRKLSPIYLSGGKQPRFHRINFEPAAPVKATELVSVIMPCFNSAETVRLAVRSILNQSWTNLEVIAVNDASSDATGAILDDLARTEPRLKVLHNPVNVGPYVSKNGALRIANGSYITGHDADDIAVPDRIARQMQPILDDPTIKATIGHMIRLDEDAKPNFLTKSTAFSFDGIARRATISLLVEREFFDMNLGAWDCVRFGADSELFMRLQIALGKMPHILRDIIMLCLSTENGLTGNAAFGIDSVTGLSPVRLAYSKAWKAWHGKIGPGQTCLTFPPAPRAYDVPAEMRVPDTAIDALSQHLARLLPDAGSVEARGSTLAHQCRRVPATSSESA